MRLCGDLMFKKYVGMVRRYIPEPVWRRANNIRNRWFNSWARKSYSQNGEDRILDWCFDGKEDGFYVDIGAHHPKRYSNTYLLYRKGWKGLNADANPGSMRAFRQIRPRDINVEAALATERRDLVYYSFEDAALNTFDRATALERVANGCAIIRETPMTTVSLRELFDRYLPPGITIDLLTVDVEGLDYDVLQSNDWNRYQPVYILAECLESQSIQQIGSDKITQLLAKNGYIPIAKTIHTVLYKRAVPS